MENQIQLSAAEAAKFTTAADKFSEVVSVANLMIEKARLAQECEYFRLFAERGYNINDYDVTRQQDGGLLLIEKSLGEEKE